jgi:Mor family transcriptional regulator
MRLAAARGVRLGRTPKPVNLKALLREAFRGKSYAQLAGKYKISKSRVGQLVRREVAAADARKIEEYDR